MCQTSSCSSQEITGQRIKLDERIRTLQLSFPQLHNFDKLCYCVTVPITELHKHLTELVELSWTIDLGPDC